MNSLHTLPHSPPSSRKRTTVKQILSALCLVTLFCADLGQAISSSQATTVYDGVTQDKYI